jgi:flagellar protein FliO/FliZ
MNKTKTAAWQPDVEQEELRGFSRSIAEIEWLLLILGLFILAAWLARRYLPQIGKPGPVKVIGTTAVGPRERVVVVEIGDTWLVLGVGGGQVRTLHSQPKPQADGTES